MFLENVDISQFYARSYDVDRIHRENVFLDHSSAGNSSFGETKRMIFYEEWQREFPFISMLSVDQTQTAAFTQIFSRQAQSIQRAYFRHLQTDATVVKSYTMKLERKSSSN